MSTNEGTEGTRYGCHRFEKRGACGVLPQAPSHPWTSIDGAGPDAPRLARIHVTTVTPRVRVSHVGEVFAIRRVVGVDAVADAVVREAVEGRPGEHACHRTRGDIRHVVRHATPVREPGRVVVRRIAVEQREETEPAAVSR